MGTQPPEGNRQGGGERMNCPACKLQPPAHLITCWWMGIDAITAAPPMLQPCGTFAAYQRHMRKGEDACPPCADAALWHGRAQRVFRRLEKTGRK